MVTLHDPRSLMKGKGCSTCATLMPVGAMGPRAVRPFWVTGVRQADQASMSVSEALISHAIHVSSAPGQHGFDE
jgi:hypothetical protein